VASRAPALALRLSFLRGLLVESAELKAGGVGEVVQTRIQMETGVAGQARSLSALGSGRLLQASILAYPPP
jgi:hypothetical protein